MRSARRSLSGWLLRLIRTGQDAQLLTGISGRN